MEKYNLPEKVEFCKECTTSNQRPRITFDKNGVCSACNFAKHKQKAINWDKREKELISLLDKHRKNDGSYDVSVQLFEDFNQLNYVYIIHSQAAKEQLMLEKKITENE